MKDQPFVTARGGIGLDESLSLSLSLSLCLSEGELNERNKNMKTKIITYDEVGVTVLKVLTFGPREHKDLIIILDSIVGRKIVDFLGTESINFKSAEEVALWSLGRPVAFVGAPAFKFKMTQNFPTLKEAIEGYK